MEFLEEYLISTTDQESESRDLESIWSFPSLDALTTTVEIGSTQRSDQVLIKYLISDTSDCQTIDDSSIRRTNSQNSSESRQTLTTLSKQNPPQSGCRQIVQHATKKLMLSEVERQLGDGWSSRRELTKVGEKLLQNASQKSSVCSRASDSPLTPPSSCESDSSPSPLPDRLTHVEPETVGSGENHCPLQGRQNADPARKPTKVIIPLKDPNPLKLRYKSNGQGSGRLVQLTDEEKKLLVQEGLPVPIRYPLTKTDERNLKRIRRKIKNKISAQESRRKKKEYVETLEDQIKQLENENSALKDKLDIYDKTNRNLISELKQIRAKLDALSSDRFGSTLSDLMPIDNLH